MHQIITKHFDSYTHTDTSLRTVSKKPPLSEGTDETAVFSFFKFGIKRLFKVPIGKTPISKLVIIRNDWCGFLLS